MTTIYPNAGVVFKIKEILNTVLNGADLTGINSYDPEEVLNMIFDEANAALKIGIIGGTPTVDGFTVLNGTVPDTPDAGYVVLWVDSSDKHVKTVDDTGLVVDLTVAVAADYTLTGTPGTPSAGDYREYYDLDGIKHVLDENGDEVTYNVAEVDSGSIGSVAVVEDVQSKIYMEAFAKTFDKNVLLRVGDNRVQTTASVGHGDDTAVPVGDVCLLISRVKSGTFVKFVPFAAASTVSLDAATVSFDNDATGVKYAIDTAKETTGATTYLLATSSTTLTTITFDDEVFNLTSLGTLTADQVLALEYLGLSGISTSTAWEDIASQTGYTSAIWDTIIDSHVSGMEPAILDEVVNRGGNLALNWDVFEDRDTNAGISVAVPLCLPYNWETNYATISGGVITSTVGTGGPVYKLPTRSGIQLTCSVAFTSASSVALSLYSFDANNVQIGSPVAGSAHASLATVTKTMEDNTAYAVINVRIISSGATIIIDSFQLNQGATANTYSTPLNEVLKFGSRSENQFVGGNGELGDSILSDWTITGAGATFGWDSAEGAFKLSRNGATSTAYKDFPITRGTTLGLQTKDDGTVTGAIDVLTQKDGVNIDLKVTPAGWTRASVGFYYVVATSAFVTSAFFIDDNIDNIRIRPNVSGSDGDLWLGELELIYGEYTTAQITAKGYVSYEPIDLLSCPNNAGTSTVRDRAFESNGDIFLEQNVQRNAGYTKHGDPELDTTSIVANGGFDSATTSWVPTAASLASVAGGVSGNCLELTRTGGAEQYAEQVLTTVIGQKYKLGVWVKSGSSGDESFRVIVLASSGTYITGTTSATWTYYEIVFRASTVNHTLRLDKLTATAGTMLFDSVFIYPYNIQENLAPTLENLSEKGLVISGSLNQGSDVGQNHIVQSGGVEFGITVYKGLGAIIKDVNENVKQKLDKDEQRLDYQVKVITPILASGGSSVFLYSEFNAVNPKFPVNIPDAFVKASVMGDADITAVAFDNALVIVATGDSADDIESSVLIGSAMAPVTLDKSA